MNKTIRILLLASLVSFSVLELNSHLGAALFICIAVLLVLIDKRPNVLIPPMAFISAAYVLGFPTLILWPDLHPKLLSWVTSDNLEYGMLWAVRGFGAFALGYALVELLGDSKKKIKHREESSSRARIRYTIYVLSSVGWLALISWITIVIIFGISLTFIEGDGVSADTGVGTSLQVLTLLSDLRYPFFTGFLILYFWKLTDKYLYLLFVALILVSVIEIIVIGSKGSIIRVLVAMMLALAFLPNKFSPRQLLGGVLAVITIYGSFAVITEYRSIMHAERRAGRDVSSFSIQVESFTSALVRSLPFSESTVERRTEVGSEDVFGRLGDGIASFGNLLVFTGRESPYEHALESFLIPIYSVAPRVLIPEKPMFFHSGRYAREYYNWTFGGISVTLMGSFYFAWGYLGIIFGMAFFGGLLAYIVSQVRILGIYSPHWLILAVILVLPMMDVGMTFQAIMTNVIRIAVMLWLLHLLYPIVSGMMRRRVSRIDFPIKRRTGK